jgi:serine/threonine protein kinase
LDRENEIQAGRELAEHLRSIAPFNKRWQVTQTINEGTYGVVFAVKDVKTGTEGVIKVAKSLSSGNQTTEWEGFLLERIFRNVSSLIL